MKKELKGLLLIAIAVCLILWKLNVFNLPLEWAGVGTWGLIISAIMVYIIIKEVLKGKLSGIFFPLAIIGIIFDKPLGITAITPWVILVAAFLFTVAFDMMFPYHKKHYKHHHGDHNFDKYSSTISEDVDGYIRHGVTFASATKYVRSKNLVEADLSARFGALNVSFEGAEVPSKQIDVSCDASFGTIYLYLPRNWRVINKVSASFGGCDDKAINSDTDSADVTCTIVGSASFGEIRLFRV